MILTDEVTFFALMLSAHDLQMRLAAFQRLQNALVIDLFLWELKNFIVKRTFELASILGLLGLEQTLFT
jgi:hypothetical protein